MSNHESVFDNLWDERIDPSVREPPPRIAMRTGQKGRPTELIRTNRWVASKNQGALVPYNFTTIDIEGTMAHTDSSSTAQSVPTFSKLDFAQSRTYGATPTKALTTLSIPKEGVTDRDAQKRIKQLTNVKNAWNVLGAEYDVEMAIHQTHQKMIGAKTAEVNATVSAVQLDTAYLHLETAQAQGVQAELQRNFEIAKIPVLQKQFEINFNSLVLQTQQLAMTDQKLQEDVAFFGEMLQLDGYSVEQLLSGETKEPLALPQFDKPDFSKLSMSLPESAKGDN